METAPIDRSPDASHLTLIAIFHYVLAGFSALGTCFLIFSCVVMNATLSNPQIVEKMKEQQAQQMQSQPGAPQIDPTQILHMVLVVYGVMAVFILIHGLLNVISGICIQKRSARMYSLVVSGVNCIFVPFGTALAVFTFIVLLRPTVQALYAEKAAQG